MMLKTARFGEFEIGDEEILHFPAGILGFEQVERYVMLELEADSPFRFLQAVDDGNLTFVVIDPTAVDPEYRIEVSREALGDWADREDAAESAQVWAIVTIPPDGAENMTANLRAPVVIDLNGRTGRQVVLSGERYAIRHPIAKEGRSLAARSA